MSLALPPPAPPNQRKDTTPPHHGLPPRPNSLTLNEPPPQPTPPHTTTGRPPLSHHSPKRSDGSFTSLKKTPPPSSSTNNTSPNVPFIVLSSSRLRTESDMSHGTFIRLRTDSDNSCPDASRHASNNIPKPFHGRASSASSVSSSSISFSLPHSRDNSATDDAIVEQQQQQRDSSYNKQPPPPSPPPPPPPTNKKKPQTTLFSVLADDIQDYLAREAHMNIATDGTSPSSHLKKKSPHRRQRSLIGGAAAGGATQEDTGRSPSPIMNIIETPVQQPPVTSPPRVVVASSQRRLPHHHQQHSGQHSVEEDISVKSTEAQYLFRLLNKRKMDDQRNDDDSRSSSACSSPRWSGLPTTWNRSDNDKQQQQQPPQPSRWYPPPPTITTTTTQRRADPSPRPPISRGSHRPGLPSIENDDWERDDWIERKEVERTNRRRMRTMSRELDMGPEAESSVSEFTTSSGGSGGYSSSSEDWSSSEEGSEYGEGPLETDRLMGNDRGRSAAKMTTTTNGDWRGGGGGRLPRRQQQQQQHHHKHDLKRNGAAVKMRQHDGGYGTTSKDVFEPTRKKKSTKKHPPPPPSTSSHQIKRSSSYSSIADHFASPKQKPTTTFQQFHQSLLQLIYHLEVLISNIPSLVGALALAWASMGVDWFKWTEETFLSCQPVDFHNAKCTYPEFPGCFRCDTTSWTYRLSLHWHLFCSGVSLVLIFCFLGKLCVAYPMVREELSNPTTAAPAGLVTMAMLKVCAGRWEPWGHVVTVTASAVHVCIATWFIFISIVFRTLPDPGWYPNTTGIGLAAVKMFLYHPYAAMALATSSVICVILFFPLSLVRVYANKRSIGAPKAFIQMSGPAVCLYGLTIFSQPHTDLAEMELWSLDDGGSFRRQFYMVHRDVYLPLMHFFFALTMIGFVSGVHGLVVRWKDFKTLPFSPAHTSFCPPILSHVNALQAYRGVLNKFGRMGPGTLFKKCLYLYWSTTLILGSILTIYITILFILHLPTWVNPPIIDDDEIPPEPNETLIAKIITDGVATDKIIQPYTSAAILQANETGALVRVMNRNLPQRPVGAPMYVRSRRVPSMGFDVMMDGRTLDYEREALLEYVAIHSPRGRSRTSSFPYALLASSGGGGGGGAPPAGGRWYQQQQRLRDEERGGGYGSRRESAKSDFF